MTKRGWTWLAWAFFVLMLASVFAAGNEFTSPWWIYGPCLVLALAFGIAALYCLNRVERAK